MAFEGKIGQMDLIFENIFIWAKVSQVSIVAHRPLVSLHIL
jgi:hypothetical protein